MNNETLDRMRQLRLYEMYDAFKTNLETSVKDAFTTDQFVSLLVASEWDDRRSSSDMKNVLDSYNKIHNNT